MAKQDRCSICDYTREHGSAVTHTPAGGNGRVVRYGNDYLCDACANSVEDTLLSYQPEPEEE